MGKSILQESLEEVITEDWNGAGIGGTGANTRGRGVPQSQTGSKPWQPGSPPFRGMTGSPGGINVQDIAAENEEIAKLAGKNKMFPLEGVNENLADAYIQLTNAEIQLKSCVKYNKVLTKDEEKKLVLENCFKKVKVIKEMIKSISQDFDRITLS